jgi:hypothetical protein
MTSVKIINSIPDKINTNYNVIIRCSLDKIKEKYKMNNSKGLTFKITIIEEKGKGKEKIKEVKEYYCYLHYEDNIKNTEKINNIYLSSNNLSSLKLIQSKLEKLFPESVKRCRIRF